MNSWAKPKFVFAWRSIVAMLLFCAWLAPLAQAIPTFTGENSHCAKKCCRLSKGACCKRVGAASGAGLQWQSVPACKGQCQTLPAASRHQFLAQLPVVRLGASAGELPQLQRSPSSTERAKESFSRQSFQRPPPSFS